MTLAELEIAGLCWLCEGSGKMAVAVCSPTDSRFEAWPCDQCGGTGKAPKGPQREIPPIPFDKFLEADLTE